MLYNINYRSHWILFFCSTPFWSRSCPIVPNRSSEIWIRPTSWPTFGSRAGSTRSSSRRKMTSSWSSYRIRRNPSKEMHKFSVTKFDEISSLWQNLKSLGQLWGDLISIWQIFGSNLASFVCNWANFRSCKWPNVDNNLAITLVTLTA